MKLVKNVYRFGLIAAIGFLTVTSCSDKADERDAEAATSALIQTNKNIVAFGHMSVDAILEKADYKKLPKVNVIVGSEYESWKNGLDLRKPIYFAVKAPFAQDGTPETVYGLVNVKDEAKLIDKFSQMGFAVEKNGEITYFSDGDVTVGVRNKLAIILTKKAPYDGKTAIAEAFKATEGDKSEGKTKDILSAKGDIVSGVSFERMYSTSSTSLENLDEAKKAELSEMVADAYIQTSVDFNKGELRITSKNMFPKALKDRLFFKEDNKKAIIGKLGNGDAWMGMSMNIDMQKFESFLIDFAPGAYEKLKQNMPGTLSIAMMTMGEKPFTKMFSGQLGVVAVGQPVEGMLPAFNFYVGLGSQGDKLVSMATGFAEGMQMQKQGDAYIMDQMAIAPRKDGLYGYTVGSSNGQKLNIPGFAKEFGKKPFSMFVHFAKMDMASFELPEGQRVLEIMESLEIYADEDGSELVLKAKDKSQNILKQTGLFYTNMLEESVSGMSDDMVMEE